MLPALPTGADALATHFDHLTEYERTEILQFSEVSFVGQGAEKQPSNSSAVESNHGFDDERGDYNVIQGDHLGYRYEVTGMLGKGSFGQVVQAWDHKNQQAVAVKIIRNKQRFHKQVHSPHALHLRR